MTLEQAIWWTGASVLTAGAALSAALIVASATIVAVMIARYYVQRFGNMAQNMRWMHEWVRAGKPHRGSTDFVE